MTATLYGCRAGKVVGAKTVHIGWSADSTRIALADAGDTLEDGNFEYGTADTAILRLTNEKEFVESTIASIGGGAFRKPVRPHIVALPTVMHIQTPTATPILHEFLRRFTNKSFGAHLFFPPVNLAI